MTRQGKKSQQQNKGQVSEKDRPRTRSQSFQSDSEKDYLKAHSQSSQSEEQPSENSQNKKIVTSKHLPIDSTKKVLIRKIEDRYGNIRLPSKYQNEVKEERRNDDIFTLDISSLETGNNNISVVFSFI
jgi:hypothetical protein